MTFDIHALDRLEEYDEEDAVAYQDALIDLFIASPEGQAHAETDPEMGFWAYQSMYFAHAYIGVTLPEMNTGDIEELLLDIFPRKISFNTMEELETAVPEIIAFWHYLQRAYKLPNAAAVLAALKKIQPGFVRNMTDPNKFGMAKSFFMEGKAAGFDMTDENEMNAFMHLHNLASLPGQAEAPPLPPDTDTLIDLLENDQNFSRRTSSTKRSKARAAKKKKKKQRRRR